MSNLQDLYAVLGVPPDAADDDIRRAYRNAARRFHPDVNPNPGAATQFRDMTTAYETLSDPIARQKHDQKRRKADPDKAYFVLRVTPSKRVLPVMNESQVLYLLIELLPDRSIAQRQIVAPMNLTLMIDRSTSMNGARLEHTKVAAHQIIDQLSNQDILSVVTFSDRADVIIKAAPLMEKNPAKVMVTTMQASGGTEIYQGLLASFEENKRYAGKKYINHIILITDGRTYGDETQSLALAEQAAEAGIGISAMGIGDEWNDVFLDQLASRTGGSTEYIRSANAVVRFLNERVRSLGQALAERVGISLAPDPDIKMESAFRLTPSPQPLIAEIDPILLGQLQGQSSTSVLLQLQMPPLMHAGFRSLLRVEVTGDIMWDQQRNYRTITDTSIEVANDAPQEDPPLVILDALGKLTLYRMQQRIQESLQQGDVREATRRLENLATRLLAAGQEELANAAMSEARRVANTNSLSGEGQKNLKYGTRMLLLGMPKDTSQ